MSGDEPELDDSDDDFDWSRVSVDIACCQKAIDREI